MQESNDRRMRTLCGIVTLTVALGSAACGGARAPAQEPGPEPADAARADSIEAARRAEAERRRLEEERRRAAEEEARRRQEEEARRAAAEAPQQASGREHVVRRGDTLWDLASFYLRNPFLWGVIYEANRGVVEDPHWIFPAERLVIPGLPPIPADAAGAAVKASRPRRTRFYRGRAASVAQPADSAAGIVSDEIRHDLEVPQVRPGEFYSAPWLAEPDELERVAEVVAVVGRSTDESRLPETANRYNTIYLRPLGGAAPAVGDRLLVVRLEEEVGGWGRVVEPMAIVAVTALHEETVSAEVIEQYGLVEEGGYAVALEEFPGLVVLPPQPVDGGPEGTLIGFEVPQPLLAPRDRAFIDLGREDGIEVGDELVAYRPSRPAPRGGVMLPPEEVARLRVVRVAERSATVQVIDLDQATLRPGMPVRLVAKRP
ncbi:MAG TPA: hypothetical protein VF212_14185 [Longimicrobiales bacterium]